MINKYSVGKRALAAMVAALAVTACSDTTGPDALDEALLLDIALVAADATIEDVNTFSQPFGFSGAQGVPGFGGAFSPGQPGGRHGIGGELSGTREVSFFDIDGNEQDHYNPQTTERIHFVAEISGEVSRASWSASLARERDMNVTGLTGDETERTFNGSGSEEVSRSRHNDGGERSYDLSGSFSYDNVVVPVPGSDPRYPLSGTITRSMSATIVKNGETTTRSVDITITFDGDETATIVVNGETMEIDLTTRDGRHPIRGKGQGQGNSGG